MSLPGRGPSTNPYLLQLIDSVQATGEAEIDYFSWRRALLGRYDVFHVHWPERLVRGSSTGRTAARRVRFLALLVRLAAARRTAVVRTLHNLRAHEAGDRLEQALLNAFERRTDLRIRLNPFTPVPVGAAVRTIPHGHYRDWMRSVDAPSVPGRLLFFGLVRPYKGVEELLAALEGVDRAHLSLRIVGSAQDPDLRAAIERAARIDPRVAARLEYVDDAALAREIAEAQLVVLPYRQVHNSGAALMALSLGRRLLMPRTDTTEWLRDEVGAAWMTLYDGPLTPAVLADAVVEAPSGDGPPMPDREWGPIAAAHVEAFRSAVALRRQSRRYST